MSCQETGTEECFQMKACTLWSRTTDRDFIENEHKGAKETCSSSPELHLITGFYPLHTPITFLPQFNTARHDLSEIKLKRKPHICGSAGPYFTTSIKSCSNQVLRCSCTLSLSLCLFYQGAEVNKMKSQSLRASES